MVDNTTNILARYGFVEIPNGIESASQEALATIMMNLSYYGYCLNQEAFAAVQKLSDSELAAWWAPLEKEFKSITGDDRKIGDFVVYKNFPAEVLDKSFAEYWIPQLLMYWGFPKEFFTEEVVARAPKKEKTTFKLLKRAGKFTLKSILDSLVASPARWKTQESNDVLELSSKFNVNFAKFAFKENLVYLASVLIARGESVLVSNATDVLRLAAGLSESDVSLRENVKLKSFDKKTRRYLLSMLEKSANLAEDVARRPEMWKKFLHHLHPGDWASRFPNVCSVMNQLYHNNLMTFNTKVEALLLKKDPEVLKLLSTRPGDFRRRLVHTIDLFGDKAVKEFSSQNVLDKLTTMQLVTLRSYLETVNDRFHRVFPPKGNWNKLQIGEARWVNEPHVNNLVKSISSVLSNRLPKIHSLDEATKLVKLPNNGAEVSPYSRGTVFPIPKNVNFIRTASYWKKAGYSTTWFDNGWNFFDSEWNNVGACCWNQTAFPGYNHSKQKKNNQNTDGAVFSGDPVNSKEMEGRAAQLIDLYPEQLRKAGVRYAVWNILCYSRIAFADADEVFAALQWGEDAQSGKLFEPSRCQLAFPLSGKQFTKYVCLIDLEKNEMIYLDANLAGKVESAASNGQKLSEVMPSFMEYIRSLPSVHDLFRDAKVSENDGIHVLYSDKDTPLNGESAYVFKPENKDNKFKPVDLNSLLG